MRKNTERVNLKTCTNKYLNNANACTRKNAYKVNTDSEEKYKTSELKNMYK